jgi:hypothetical protein
MKRKIWVIPVIFIAQICFAQNNNQITKGKLNGSYENYSQYYMNDAKIGAFAPQDKLGSNNFLKLDYTYGKLSAGIQYESYLPSILGYYSGPLNASKIANKYFKYTEDKFSVQVGDFYEQFGSGLIFRSFENRQIGINNALEGVNVYVEPTNFTKLKVVYGKTRNNFNYSNSVTRGADVEFDLNKLFNPKGNSNTTLNLGASYIGRFQEYTGPNDDFPSTVNAFATRLDIINGDFTFNVEFANKGRDPHLLNNYSMEKGKALLINTGYTKNNFGFLLTARSIKNMGFRAEREVEFATSMPVNYVPALTKQHDFLTSNIYVYNPQVLGESGFQTDLFFNIKPGTSLGGKYGTKVSANFSYYTALKNNKFLSAGSNKYYSDANIEVKKKWSKKFETTLTLQNIYYNASVIQAASHDDVVSNVVALNSLIKYGKQKALRLKLEHLSTKQDMGNWASAIAEFSFNSPFAFYLSDLYNYGSTKNHFYNVGASVTKNATRFSLAFGKQRPGLFCVGGVCRFVPAAYGFTATLTTSFGN